MQRTEFPAIVNTEPELYLSTLQQTFAEVQRHGGTMPFKDFRQWLRDRGLWSREDTEAWMDFLGCEMRPNVVLGEFAQRFLASERLEEQQALLYEWMTLWNPFLHKFVFDALDSEANGRMHSEHELYRIITSYVYPGDYVTLPDFQNWIRWMAASGTIRYVGIRWGLSESGMAEMPKVRQIDVEDLLEDEDMEAEQAAMSDLTQPALSGSGSESSPPVPVPATVQEPPSESPSANTPDLAPAKDVVSAPMEPMLDSTPLEEPGTDEETEFLDLPPEAPIPDWPEEDPAMESQVQDSTVSESSEESLNPAERWFGDLCGSGRPSIIDLGLDPKKYNENRSLFLFQAIVYGRLVTDSEGARSPSDLISFVQKVRFFERYFTETQPLEEKLKDIRYFRERLDLRKSFRRHTLDVMRYKSVVLANVGLCDRLENATNIRTVLNILRDEVYEGESSVAALWVASQMWAHGLWGSFAA